MSKEDAAWQKTTEAGAPELLTQNEVCCVDMD